MRIDGNFLRIGKRPPGRFRGLAFAKRGFEELLTAPGRVRQKAGGWSLNAVYLL